MHILKMVPPRHPPRPEPCRLPSTFGTILMFHGKNGSLHLPLYYKLNGGRRDHYCNSDVSGIVHSPARARRENTGRQVQPPPEPGCTGHICLDPRARRQLEASCHPNILRHQLQCILGAIVALLSLSSKYSDRPARLQGSAAYNRCWASPSASSRLTQRHRMGQIDIPSRPI